MKNWEKSAAIIIATLNREKVLINTIESILHLKHQPDEFWIIDQTKQHEDATELYLDEVQKRGVKVVRLPNPGVCYARNLGAILSKSDILIYIDDDVIIEDHEFIEKHKKNYIDTTIHSVQGQIIEHNLYLFSSINENLSSRKKRISTFVTANVSILRDVFLNVGGFDEGFSGRTYANEDGDLGLRLFNAGYTIVLDTIPSLIHLKSSTGGNRITGRDGFPEWTRSVTFFQFAFRHLDGFSRIRRFFGIFRLIALRKENILQPWKLPIVIIHCMYALIIAALRNRSGFKSSIFDPGTDQIRLKYDYIINHYKNNI
jgi:GT2 family glycosyltransferase